MRLSNYCSYTDYSHVSTGGPLADSYMSACHVKFTTLDRIECVNLLQSSPVRVILAAGNR